MSSNSNLVSAKIVRNDEYYTRLEDVEGELSHYPGAFQDKVVLLPCDSANRSAFWTYFENNFNALGLRRLIATLWNEEGKGRKSVLEHDSCGELVRCDSELSGNGDMFSDEIKAIMSDADLVVTNVPFSRFRDCVRLMMDLDLDFVIIGGKNGGKYQDTIQYVVDGKMRLGVNAGHGTMTFEVEDGTCAAVGSYWYTTLVPDVPPRSLEMTHHYAGNEKSYPKYANYDAIEVSKVSLIPSDYMGRMGVPVTFLEYYDPDRWELLGTNATVLKDAPQDPEIKANSHLYRRHNLYIEEEGGEYKYRRIYDRLIIQRRGEDPSE